MKTEKINQILLIVVMIMLFYLIFFAPNRERDRFAKCFDASVRAEKARHQPIDDLEVSNLDISLFQKNFIYCISDNTLFR